jgi:hypothetical protein
MNGVCGGAGNQLAFVETLRDQHLTERERYFEQLEEVGS